MTLNHQPDFENQSERDYENYVQSFMPTAQEMIVSSVDVLKTSFALLDEELHRWKALALKFGGECAAAEFEAEMLQATKHKEPDNFPF